VTKTYAAVGRNYYIDFLNNNTHYRQFYKQGHRTYLINIEKSAYLRINVIVEITNLLIHFK